MSEEDLNNLREFYNSIKNECALNFKELVPGTYGLGYSRYDQNILRDDIVLELSFPTMNLTEETSCVVNIWYYFPEPCQDDKLIRGLQRTKKIASRLKKKNYESNFQFGRSYGGHVIYNLKKKVENKEDVEQVFQELSDLESLLTK